MQEERLREGIQKLILPLEKANCSPLQAHFLQRLDRLLRLRYEQGDQLNPWGVQLLDRVIYSSYCDCLDEGVSELAQGLLRRYPLASADPAAKG